MNPDLLALAKCRWQQAEIGQQLPHRNRTYPPLERSIRLDSRP